MDHTRAATNDYLYYQIIQQLFFFDLLFGLYNIRKNI